MPETNSSALTNDCLFPCYMLAFATYTTGMMTGSPKLQGAGLMMFISLLVNSYTLSRPYQYWCQDSTVTFFRTPADNRQPIDTLAPVMEV